MGMLINGKWETKPLFANDDSGKFIRPDSSFRNWVSADGSSGFQAAANRYHLYVSYACPWACRTLTFRVLKGLQDCISFSVVKPEMLENGWELGAEENEYHFLYEIYQKAKTNYTGKVTVPVLWDKESRTIVNNESADIIRMLNTEFNQFTEITTDYYPTKLRNEINKINEYVYDNINNGVYKCGFAKTQPAYDEAVSNLFSALDKIEKILSENRYLVGDTLTEADWRLFPTLVRFDPVYVGHFKCNIRRIEDYPCLSNYLRELYQHPGIQDTVNFDHIKSTTT